MSSTRSIISPPPFASTALTVIPPTPVAGVTYRDETAGPASSPDGWPYAERVNSAEWNQIMYQLSSLVSIMDKKGILGWSSAVDYTEAGVTIGSDGELYSWVSASGPNNGGAKDPASGANPASWTPLRSSLSTSIVGAAKNVRMSIAAASASGTLTADQIIVTTSLAGSSYRLSSFSHTINLATTGAGGMDTGAAPASGYVAVYAIYNPATNTAALLATNATAAIQPEVYGGGNMPAGYTASALVSVWPTTAAGLLIVGAQAGRFVWFAGITVLSTTTANGTLTSLSISSAVPRNAVSAKVRLSIAAVNSGVTMTCSVAGSTGQVGISTSASTSPAASSGLTAEAGIIPIITTQTIFYTDAVSSGAIAGFNIVISGYEF